MLVRQRFYAKCWINYSMANFYNYDKKSVWYFVLQWCSFNGNSQFFESRSTVLIKTCLCLKQSLISLSMIQQWHSAVMGGKQSSDIANKQIVIIGGGYGGSHLAYRLIKKNIGKVTLIEPKDGLFHNIGALRTVVDESKIFLLNSSPF